MIRPYITISYGELLRLFRRKNRLTIKEVADILSVTPETINNYETNRTIPSGTRIVQLEKLYGGEFERLSTHLRTEKTDSVKKSAKPLRLLLEAPRIMYHGTIEGIVRKKRSRRYKLK